MKRLTYVFLVLCLSFMLVNKSIAQNISSFKLDNGLTVILNEDQEQPLVFGAVVVKTGSKNDPPEATGISHYLEHMMFKGTQQMGTINWESEKPHYEATIDLFEQLRSTTDEVKKKEIFAKINEEAKLAGQFIIPNDFSNLVQAIGGVNLNASTSLDQTQYYCMFPSFELGKWADLYSSLFQQSVFRGFQTEVEAVFEEKNMYADNPMSSVSETLYKYVFENHPYGNPIIGSTDHLKNPSLKLMIEYFQKWYVPSNMAVILSGRINPEEAKAIVTKTFGLWKPGKTPEATYTKLMPIKGNNSVTIKKLPYKMGIWAFNGVQASDKNNIPIEVLAEILSNSNKTGLLDKLQIDGDVSSVTVGSQSLIDGGRIIIESIPMFDRNQLRQLSVSETESIIFKEIEKLKNGEFDDWLLQSVKNQMLQDLEMANENTYYTASYLMSFFVQNRSIEDFLKIKDEIKGVNKEQIVALANQYLNKDYIAFQCLEGSESVERVKKPAFDLVDLPKNAISEYRKKFMTIPSSEVEEKYIDFSKEISKSDFAPGVKMFYKNNKRNSIFTLNIRYGAGTKLFPTLDYAVALMNRAGIMGQYSPQEFKQEMAKIGCKLNIYNSDGYTNLKLSGDEAKLGEACFLLSKLTLLPKLDQKQFDAIIGNDIMSRRIEKTDNDLLSEALKQYLFYGTESDYLSRLTSEEVSALTIKGLTGDFIRATQYEAQIHYCGKMPQESVVSILKESLAFPEGLKKSDSPVQKKLAENSENTIYFLNNSESKQSGIYFFVNGGQYSFKDESIIEAFNQYFDGGFNGLVLQEIRENRAMAYTASGKWNIPSKPELKMFFSGYVGTQADKTIDAVKLYVSLIKNMPHKPERMDNIKSYLVNSSLTLKPSPRNLTLAIDSWETMGYKTDPSQILIPQYRNMSFEDIVKFYSDKMMSKSYSIAIVGDKKLIDLKQLSEFGKVVQLNSSKIFK